MPTSIQLPSNSASFKKFKNGNETELTYSLKWAAWKWLWEVAECRVIAFEVRLEGPFGRVADVVGLGPENKVFLIEVKSSRADLRRDDNNERARKKLRKNSRSLDEAAEHSQKVVANAHAASKVAVTTSSKSSRAVAIAESEAQGILEKAESTKKRIESLSTKFHDPAYLRCADYHYLMTPHRMIRTTEIPAQWGLLNEQVETVVEAPLKQVKRVTQHVLREIARANTRDLMKACEVEVERTP
jgi:cell division septum initiation protein DivIVA